MNKLLGLILIFITSACNSSTEDLTDYSTRIVEHDVKVALNEQNVRFMFVCGFACTSPSIGFLEHALCFKFVGSKTIGPIGDYQVDFRLQQYARVYAENYNKLLLSHLKPKSTCPVSEQWNEAIEGLDEYLKFKFGEDTTTAFPLPISLNSLIYLDIRKPYIAKDLISDICNIFKNNGVYRKLGINTNDKSNYICINGAHKEL